MLLAHSSNTMNRVLVVPISRALQDEKGGMEEDEEDGLACLNDDMTFSSTSPPNGQHFYHKIRESVD